MKWGAEGDESFEDALFGAEYSDGLDEYEADLTERCPECRSSNVQYFGVGVDKCNDCGAFLEAEDFDDDQEGTDPIHKHGYRDEWDY